MKSLKKLLFTLLLGTMTVGTLSAQKTTKGKERIRFEVDLDCHSCVKKIEQSIPYEKGVTDLKQNMDEQWVEVEYRVDKTDKKKLIAAFNKLGKKATEIVVE